MKKIITALIIFAVSLYGYNETNTGYEIDNNEKNSFYLSNYFDRYFDNGLDIFSVTFIKASEDNKQVYENYLKNYFRGNVTVGYSSENYRYYIFGGGEFYSKDNYKSSIIGLDDRYRMKNGGFTGSGINYDYSGFKGEVFFKYGAKNFEKIGESNNKKLDDEVDSDIRFFTRVSYSNEALKNFSPFAEFEHFNDLNDEKSYNYNVFKGGINYTNKFNTKYYMNGDFYARIWDVYENMPLNLGTDIRFTAKYSQDYMVLSKLVTNAWMNKNTNDWYYGDTYFESIGVKNFSFNHKNQVDRLYLGGRYQIDDEYFMLKAGAVYNFLDMTLEGEYRYYSTDDYFVNSAVEGKLWYNFFDYGFKAGYSLLYKDLDDENIDDEVIHSIGITYLL